MSEIQLYYVRTRQKNYYGTKEFLSGRGLAVHKSENTDIVWSLMETLKRMDEHPLPEQVTWVKEWRVEFQYYDSALDAHLLMVQNFRNPEDCLVLLEKLYKEGKRIDVVKPVDVVVDDKHRILRIRDHYTKEEYKNITTLQTEEAIKQEQDNDN